MSREKDPECRGYLLAESGAALHVCASPTSTESWWIPRSQVGYLRIDRDPSGDCPRIVFTVPEWLLEKNQAWALVP